MPFGNEDRVIAETAITAWRPDKSPVDAALETFLMSIRPAQDEGADEMRPPVCAAGGRKRAFHLLHCHDEILVRTGPSRRIDPRRAVQRRHDQSGIIGQRRLAGRRRGGPCLQRGIAKKAVLGFLGFGQVIGLCRGDTERPAGKQRRDLAQFTIIVRGNYQFVTTETTRHGSSSCYALLSRPFVMDHCPRMRRAPLPPAR